MLSRLPQPLFTISKLHMKFFDFFFYRCQKTNHKTSPPPNYDEVMRSGYQNDIENPPPSFEMCQNNTELRF